MADANALTYAQLVAAVLQNRFPASLTGTAQQWLAVAYQEVWDAANWTFKHVSRASFYTSADGTSSGTATETPLMPTAFADATRLLDDLGCPLGRYSQGEFEDAFTSDTSTGRPWAYAVIDRQVHLGPTPDKAYLFKLSYRRRLAHKDASGNVVAGFLAADTDVPVWDDHHRVLVPRAQMIGLKEKNDPTWPPLDDEWQRGLLGMRRDYLPAMRAQYPKLAW